MNILPLVFVLFIASCMSSRFAPVESAWFQESNPRNTHIVQSGESLYAIAWRYNFDYQKLAKLNALQKPYVLHKGEKLNINLQELQEKVINNKIVAKGAGKQKVVAKSWVWPADGKVVRTFSLNQKNKGIDISGKSNDPIFATAKGEVVYSGGDIKGYGNLLIIKHTDELFSAYAYNKEVLVKEGNTVMAGQLVARMGGNNNSVFVHFEIRKFGDPVNPILYLPTKI